MKRQTQLAIAVAVGLAFALGIFFDTIMGWSAGFGTPTVAANCPTSGNELAACATLASAEATATIARWTRLDAAFSLFTALAAYFAYRAYGEAKRQADAAESSLQHALDASERERELVAIERRANLQPRQVDLDFYRWDEGEDGLAIQATVSLDNIGLTDAYDVTLRGSLRFFVLELSKRRINLESVLPVRCEAGSSQRCVADIETKLSYDLYATEASKRPFTMVLRVAWRDAFDYRHERSIRCSGRADFVTGSNQKLKFDAQPMRSQKIDETA